jgi:hypothetical protein
MTDEFVGFPHPAAPFVYLREFAFYACKLVAGDKLQIYHISFDPGIEKASENYYAGHLANKVNISGAVPQRIISTGFHF